MDRKPVSDSADFIETNRCDPRVVRALRAIKRGKDPLKHCPHWLLEGMMDADLIFFGSPRTDTAGGYYNCFHLTTEGAALLSA